TEIVEPLEEEINTIEGLKELRSTAREEVATVIAEFELWRDIDAATQDVRDRVLRARRRLPDDIEEPIVLKIDPDARSVMWIALTGDERWSDVRMSRYADEAIKPRLENLRGVGRIQIGGERRYAVRVRVDPERLAARRVTIREVVDAIRRNNVDIPSGRIESETREFLVETRGQFGSAEPINDLIVVEREGGPVRIRDIGEAVDGVETDRQTARFVNRIAVGLGVVKQSEANTVSVTRAVRRQMERLAADFPSGLTYTINSDDSIYIEDSIRDLLFTIGLTTALVALVVLGFLRTWAGTLVAALSIPCSLLGGLAFMYAMGFSLNTLTMLALILAIGIVVDDTIVVLESVSRHVERGAEGAAAARVGVIEVAFASVANTVSLAAVFVPVAFTAGLIGRFFFEFGLTVAATVGASTATALTLTAMLSARLSPPPRTRGKLYRLSETVYAGLEKVYGALLRHAFRARWLTTLIAAVSLGLGFWFATLLSTEFAATVDRSHFIVAFELPEGATFRPTYAYAVR
ncbi:MAG: efflux RND transporter permease subunit, partial [Pirellulaceae bacterium]|nr:efflux RND transporter permease subunit [Pirellulaceae bacterium]